MAAKKLTDNTKIDVYNNTTYDIGYYVEGIKRREWMYGANPVVKIPLGEIENALGDVGCYNMYTRNKLLIKDVNVREHLGLPPLEDVVSYDDVKEMLENKNVGTIEETLKNAKETNDVRVLEMVADLAIELRVGDLSILSMIKEYADKDVEEAIKDAIEEDDKKKAKGKATK